MIKLMELDFDPTEKRWFTRAIRHWDEGYVLLVQDRIANYGGRYTRLFEGKDHRGNTWYDLWYTVSESGDISAEIQPKLGQTKEHDKYFAWDKTERERWWGISTELRGLEDHGKK